MQIDPNQGPDFDPRESQLALLFGIAISLVAIGLMIYLASKGVQP